MPIRLPLNRWTLTGLVVAICSLVIWEWVALVNLALACLVWTWICWIPAMATSGVMLASTALHMTPELDQRIRTYAGWLAAGGITAGILGTGLQHYLEAAHITPSPWVALPLGGIPVFMGGLLVHLLSMVFAQRRREQAHAEAAQAKAEANRQALVVAENDRQLRASTETAEHDRKLQHQRELTAEAKRTADEITRQALAAKELREATEKRAEVAREVLAKPHLVVVGNTRKTKAASGDSPSEQAQAWLIEQHHAGIALNSADPRVGPSAIAAATGLNAETCRKSHKKWKAAVADELTLIAELAEAAG